MIRGVNSGERREEDSVLFKEEVRIFFEKRFCKKNYSGPKSDGVSFENIFDQKKVLPVELFNEQEVRDDI